MDLQWTTHCKPSQHVYLFLALTSIPFSGEFILTHPDMRIPKKRAIYSVNEGNSLYWEDNTKKYFESLKFPGEGGKPYSSRYIGSMVADAYRTLLYGGIFAYPADKKSPKGKLRILYECAVSFPFPLIILDYPRF